MTFQLFQPTKLLFTALMITTLFCGTTHIAIIPVFAQNSGILAIISEDTIWTKANSPYTLTGNLLVENNYTLTIEAGVTVNLNDFYIMVNGTLCAQGTETEEIQFIGGEIKFTKYSKDWDEQTGSGNIIEHSSLEFTDVEITSVSPKINSNSLSAITLGGSTILTNNMISQEIAYSYKLETPIVTGNTILHGGTLPSNGPAVVCNNSIYGSFSCTSSGTFINNTVSDGLHLGGSLLATNNTVKGSMDVVGEIIVSNNIVSGSLTLWGSPTVTNNTINGVTVKSGNSITISHNTIIGGISLSPTMPSTVNASILNNTITGCDVGIYLSPSSAINMIGGCASSAYIYGNTISDCSTGGIKVEGESGSQAGYEVYNTAIIDANTIINTNCGIELIKANGEIKNNIIAHNEIGISSIRLIDGNLITNNTYGIKYGWDVTSNTIVNNWIGIESSSIKTLVNNNIYDNSEYNIRYLSSSSLTASNNWWGTTDPDKIAQKIYDYYEDFELGKVNYEPILNDQSPTAPQPQTVVISEFPSWIVLPFVIVGSLAIIFYKNKIHNRFSKFTL